MSKKLQIKKFRSLLEEMMVCRTLIIEDNAIFRQSLKEMLCNAFPSMLIEEAKNGKEALKKIEVHTPDLIFMDVRLPRASGITLTKKIKTAHPNIIIAVLTSYDLPEYRNAALQSGANHFLSKSSSTRKHIIELVESILTDKSSNCNAL